MVVEKRKCHGWIAIPMFLGILLILAATTRAEIMETKLLPSDGAAGDWFGHSISVRGRNLIVGAKYDDTNNIDSGAAYIYERDGDGSWIETAKLIPGDGGFSEYFGCSVAVDGHAIVGAYGDNAGGAYSGAAYVFTSDSMGNWTEYLKVTASDAAPYDYFGYSVSFDNPFIIVGAYGDDDFGDNSGAAYIYRVGIGSATEVIRLTADDGAASDYFGYSVAIDSRIAAVGASGDDDNGSSSGSVYVYETSDYENWTLMTKLKPSDGDSGDRFGHSISITHFGSRTFMIVGAFQDEDNGVSSGSAYIFERYGSDWIERAKLTAGTANDWFGYSVSIFGNRAVVGAPQADGLGATDCGAVYLFEETAPGVWTQAMPKILPGDFAGSDSFGGSVAITDAYLLTDDFIVFAGAHQDDDNGSDSGSVYFFMNDQDEDGLADALDADIDGDGMPNGYETEKGFDPRDPVDGSQHSDSDMYDNVSEYRAATDPFSAAPTEHPGELLIVPERLFARDGSGGDAFGHSVSVFGDWAVIGAHQDANLYGDDAGSAYICRWDGSRWHQVVKLVDDQGGGRSGFFGYGVSIHGDRMAVSAIHYYDFSNRVGVIYIYERDGMAWNLAATLIPSDGKSVSYAVALNGDRVIAGTYLANDSGNRSGVAFIFERDGEGNWNEAARLTASDGATDDYFGESVAICGDRAIVGAYLDDDNGEDSGSAYIFERDAGGTWHEVAKIIASGGDANDHFGIGASISGDTVIVGADTAFEGRAYIYEWNGSNWLETAQLRGDTIVTGGHFGRSVSVDGNLALVGAYDAGAGRRGMAHLYQRNDDGLWLEVAEFAAGDGADYDSFGYSVALAGKRAVIGAYQDDDAGEDSGAVYAYAILDLDQDDRIDTRDADIDGDGLPNGYEREKNFDMRNSADGGQDGDGDGADNFAEYHAATNPESASEYPGMLNSIPYKMFVEDGVAGDRFGQDVALDGDRALVKAAGKDFIYVVERDGDASWSEVGRIHSSGQYSIYDLSLDGDRAAVSSYSSVHIFEREVSGIWSQAAEVEIANGANCVLQSISLRGDIIIAGHTCDSDNGSYAGAAYIFERDSLGNWQEVAKIKAADGEAGDKFGYSVSVDGTLAIVGAPYGDELRTDSGAAYVFERDGMGNWTQTAKLISSDDTAEEFGISVAISGELVIVGSPKYFDIYMLWETGAAYVFERESPGIWNQFYRLTPSDGADLDGFGASVSIDGERAIIGAAGNDEPRTDGGAAYIFELTGEGIWAEAIKLSPGDIDYEDYFGSSVAVSGARVIVASPLDDDSGSYSGTVYFYSLDQDNDGIADSRDADIDGDGMPNSYETSNGFNPKDPSDGSQDADLDGYDNTSEFRAGTDPHDQQDNPDQLILVPQKAFAADGTGGDFFGYSVALSQDLAVVGAYESGPGVAYVYEWNGLDWGPAANLTAGDGLGFDYFGCSVSISGDLILVGAYGDNHDPFPADAGSAYVYERDASGNWHEAAKLVAADRALSDNFGVAVALDGNRAVIGALLDDDNGTDSGSAYVFERDEAGNWIQVVKLTASDGAGNAYFGRSVDIENDRIVVGAYGQDTVGAIYVFERDGSGNWNEVAALKSMPQAVDDFFGYSVAIEGNRVFAGSYQDDEYGADSGSVYVFDRDDFGNWIQSARIVPGDGETDDHFGVSVSISNDRLIVGADQGFGGPGKTYVFDWNGVSWEEVIKLTVNDASDGDRFGHSVSIDLDRVVIGAYHDDGAAGSVYFFALDQDRDSDGMGDLWEQQIIQADPNKYDIYDVDPLDDYDTDGFCNLREFLSISDPRNDMDIPDILADYEPDGGVDGVDLSFFLDDYQNAACLSTQCYFDFDADNDVDFIDLFLFAEDYGRIN